jgi:hypothetical protein
MALISDLKKRTEPLAGGVQIQNRKKRGIGTLACIVFDEKTGKALGLTNKHILKRRVGTSVVQPAKKKRIKKFIIGNVLRKGKNGKPNDFAVFEINTKNRSYDKKNSLYGLKGLIKETVKPKKGMKVQKVGQYTGRTFGIISKVYTNSTFQVKPNPDKPSEEISDGGDSGSIWVTDEKAFKAVGLHRAGEVSESAKDRAYAISIDRVMKKLKIRF